MASYNDTTPNLIDPVTSTVDGVTLNDSNGEALLLDGAFSIDQAIFNIQQCDHSYTIQSCDTDRFASYSFKAPTYYIQVTDDINANVTFHKGAANANDNSLTDDDAWSLSELSYNDTNTTELSVEYKLPAGGSKVQVATISVCDQLTAGATFAVDMDIALANDGAIVGEASLRGNNYDGYIAENITSAQHAYWFNEPDAPGRNDGDILVANLTTDMLELQNATNDAMTAMEEDITGVGNVVTAWSLTIDTVAAAPGSNLSQYGQSSGANDGALFAAGEKVVANAQQLYTVNITHNGGETLLVNDYVYGMVKHHSETSNRAD